MGGVRAGLKIGILSTPSVFLRLKERGAPFFDDCVNFEFDRRFEAFAHQFQFFDFRDAGEVMVRSLRVHVRALVMCRICLQCDLYGACVRGVRSCVRECARCTVCMRVCVQARVCVRKCGGAQDTPPFPPRTSLL
jgi:hypothetical protein